MPELPRLWPGETVVCIGSGTSLTQSDVDCVRGRARVIVINNNYQKATWADALYACDGTWWDAHDGVPSFTGLKVSMRTHITTRAKDVVVLENTGLDGLEASPHGLKHGKNSGYQAIGAAVHLGAAQIVLLGYDLQLGPHGEPRWHGQHRQGEAAAAFDKWLPCFPTLIEPLRARGIAIVNCTRRTALTCFPQMALEEVLVGRRRAA